MRNGINLAFVSEVAHEIHDHPEEGQFEYRADVWWNQGDAMTCRIGTVRAGTIRAARGFFLPIRAHGDDRSDHAPLPSEATELALVGLASCALTTAILGYTTMSRTLSAACIELVHGPCVEGCPQSLAYRLRFEGEGEPDTVRRVVDGVLAHSPNHRTFAEPNSITAQLEPAGRSDRSLEQVVGGRWVIDEASPRVRSAGRNGLLALPLRWEYGVQLAAWPRVSATAPHAHHWVDQPKQLGGIDKGPNPQEYLLAGLSASVIETMAKLASLRDIDLGPIECSCEGRVDVRGMMGVDPSIPARVQDIRCRMSTYASSLSGPELESLLAESLYRSPVARLLREPVGIDVEAVHGGERLGVWVDAVRYMQVVDNARVRQRAIDKTGHDNVFENF